MATYSGFCIVDPDFSRELNEKLGSGKLGVGALEIPQPAKTKARAFQEFARGLQNSWLRPSCRSSDLGRAAGRDGSSRDQVLEGINTGPNVTYLRDIYQTKGKA
jgi:hypothetical protein